MKKAFSKFWVGRTPIGLDIGSHSVKAVQLRRQDDVWCMEKSAVFPRKCTDALDKPEAQRLAAILNRLGFRNREVAIALPAAQSLTGIFELPPRGPGVPIDQIARAEFANSQKVSPHELEMSYWDLPQPARANKGTHIMAAGCRTADANQLIDMLDSAGLTAVALDHHPSALTRACATALASESSTLAIVDLGWSAATLSLVMGKTLIYERRMPELGGKQLHESLRKQFSLDDDEASLVLRQVTVAKEPGAIAVVPAVRDAVLSTLDRLGQELRLAFAYVARQYSQAAISMIYLTGGGAGVPGVTERLAESLDVKCQLVSPRVLVSGVADDSSHAQTELTAALGLALFPLGQERTKAA